MRTENWKNIKDVLLETLKLDSSERSGFLERAHLSREARREIDSLLAVEERAENFMSVSASGFTKDFFKPDENAERSLVGQQIGVYEIVRELGIGGMGAVYLARRADGKFEQKVAIKMLKREFNTEKIRRRFNIEKEIQAKLSHPNIAALLDSGTTADGVPYLVMEFIEGVSVDEFCRVNSLSLAERLKLFNRICDAVAFAHRNLIVHRDLKPSNILVSEDGKPKLLDFGISKLLDRETSDEHTLTNLGAMTPQYASPEQIKGEPVTTAADIYSLGVILFKILTGNFPFNFKNKTSENILRQIIDDEPTLPSAARQENECGNRSDSAFSLSQLKGDLDNIILKALRKNPARRYQTVEQFCADVQRHLEGLPVLARRATFSYRAVKFYGRNKISVLAVVLIFFSLLAGIAAAVSQASAARRQAEMASEARAVAETETRRAKSEEKKAEKITAFMSKIIAYANPAWYAEGARFGGDARVIDAIVDLSEKIDVEFDGQADVQAELHHKFSEVFLMAESGKSNAARTEEFEERRAFHAVRALELRRQFYGERHELVAKDLFYAYGIIGKDDREQAELLMQAIVMMRETNPNNLNFPYMLEAYSADLMLPGEYEKHHEPYRNAVSPATSENKYQIAERYLREALPVFRLHYKEDNQAILMNECKLAYVLAKQEKWTDFNEHHALCKQGALKYGDSAGVKWFADLVEKTLDEKR